MKLEKSKEDSLTAEYLVKYIKTIIDDKLPETDTKLIEFYRRLDEKFPFSLNPYKRGVVEMLTMYYMRNVLILYAFGQYDSVIMQLHGLLERFSVEKIKENIKTPIKSKHLLKQVNRFGLFFSIDILMDFGIIDKPIKEFLIKINKLRNAIAHKNAEGINKIRGSKSRGNWEIFTHLAVSEIECINYILDSIDSFYSILQLKKKIKRKEKKVNL